MLMAPFLQLPLWSRCRCWHLHLSTIKDIIYSKTFCRELSSSSPHLQRDAATSTGATDSEESCPANDDLQRMSLLNIQMLSRPLHQQIFGGRESSVRKSAIDRCRKHLKSQDLWGKKGSTLPDIDVELPRLTGENIDAHFRNIAEVQSRPYLDLAVELMRTPLPSMPTEWSFNPGWTKYDPSTGEAISVDYPEDSGLVFDVEVCTMESPRPILATAASQRCWYSWVSKRLTSSEDFYANMQRRTVLGDLIPFEMAKDGGVESATSNNHRLIVGHNVSFDRARIREQYYIKGSKTKFLDTLSLHACTSGQTTRQKVLWKSKMSKVSSQSRSRPWFNVSSPNGLAEVHWLHISQGGRRRVSKDRRDVFMKGTVQDVRGDFQNLMQYCAEDVFYTHEVLQRVLPLFLDRCPHPVTLAGMLEMGSAYLPVNDSWEEFIANAEYYYEEIQNEIKTHLMALANDACSYSHNKRYNNSPWLCNLDWSTKKFRGRSMKKADMNKVLEKIEDYYDRNEQLFLESSEEKSSETSEKQTEEEDKKELEFLISSLGSQKASRPVHMPGYPEWYRALCMKRTAPDWKYGAVNLSAQSRVTPYLLRMKWKGHPLYCHPKLKWGYIISPDLKPGEVPQFKDDNIDLSGLTIEEADELSVEDMIEEHCEELQDEELLDTSLGNNNSADSATAEPKKTKKTPAAKRTKNKKSTVSDEDQGSSEATKEENEKWRPQSILTDWGRTDDVVTIGNGDRYYYFKIPHKDGPTANCGNPLSKDYLPKMEDGTLSSASGHLGKRILTLNSMLSFWRSARSRVIDQFVVWSGRDDPAAVVGEGAEDGPLSDDTAVEKKGKENGDVHVHPTGPSLDCGAILPMVQVAGTATRRAVEATWLTASNPKDTRVGSELKAMVRAPPGYHIVGADVDSQELWIAAVLGDMHFAGIHGCSAIGWMTLQGKKADGTDVHSVTAKTIGISRDQAKILNYGRIYGAGKPFIELLLRKFNPSLNSNEVQRKAETLYSATKGIRMYKLTRNGQELAKAMDIPLHEGACVNPDDWKLICSGLGYYEAVKLCSDRLWVGGSESHLFNKLESIAMSDLPKTPVLGCCITRALEKQYVGNDYQPSRVNWVVQSSAVDYLHLLLVNTRWLFDTYNIDGRFCISIHDEVRYLVKSEDRYRAALALQFTNLFTRAMFAHQLNMQDLPQSVAFFSAVDIDLVLRKEPTEDCKTPSNPLGLEKGHAIPHGEVLDIYQILEKTGGTLFNQNPAFPS